MAFEGAPEPNDKREVILYKIARGIWNFVTGTGDAAGGIVTTPKTIPATSILAALQIADDVTISLPAVPGARNVIVGISGGFDVAPAAPALLTIKDGSSIIWQSPVTAAGLFTLPDIVRKGSVNTDMSITLSTGNTGVTGYINIGNFWTE